MRPFEVTGGHNAFEMTFSKRKLTSNIKHNRYVSPLGHKNNVANASFLIYHFVIFSHGEMANFTSASVPDPNNAHVAD